LNIKLNIKNVESIETTPFKIGGKGKVEDMNDKKRNKKK
jgi:hypothetical protein